MTSIRRAYPRNVQELDVLVKDIVLPSDLVVMQSGHFLVYYDRTEDQLLPCISSELPGPRHNVIRDDIGEFPFLTWELATRLLSSTSARKKRALVLVNDWQYVPAGVDRARFYSSFNTLPRSYRAELEKQRDIALLSPPRKRKGLLTGDFFSEQTLRNQYARHIRRVIACDELPADAELSRNGDVLSCSLVDAMGRRQEVYCSGKRENCTHEVAELLYSVHRMTGCNVFINFFPVICKEYVEAGTELCFGIFTNELRAVINIGMPATTVRTTQDLFRACAVSVQSSE